MDDQRNSEFSCVDDRNDESLSLGDDASFDPVAEKGESARGLTSAQRLDDAKALASLGLGPAVIVDLTGWTKRFASQICDRVGHRSHGGRGRTGLLDFFRPPVLHVAISRFVAALEYQIRFNQDRKLSSRSFLTAVRYLQTTLPDEASQIPATALHSVAMQVVAGTVKSHHCSKCRSQYAQASLASRLTDQVVYDCPYCRQVAVMLPSKKALTPETLPSLSALNLRGPVVRFPSKGADGPIVRAVIGMMASSPGSGFPR